MKIQINIILFLLFICNIVYPQSLSSLSGLLNVPTADLTEDREISVGVNFLDKHHLKYANGRYDVFTPFINVGFLPWLEISIRITRQINAKYESHVMDRMFSGKIKLVNESMLIPNVTLGLQNPYSTEKGANHFNSTYLVLSKNIIFNSFINRFHFTIGYGSDIIKAADHQFLGFFGGVSFTLLKFSEFMFEYDAERFNTGLRLNLFNHIHLLGGFIDLKHFSGGASVSFQL